MTKGARSKVSLVSSASAAATGDALRCRLDASEYRAEKAALLMRGIARAARCVEDESEDVQARSDFLLMIDAAARYAHELLSGTPLYLTDFEEGKIGDGG